MSRVAAALGQASHVVLHRLPDGNYAVSMTDAAANQNRVGAFGELIVAQLDAQAAWRFDYGVNTDLVTTTVANNGTVTAASSKASLATGTHAAGSAILSSIRRLRYLPGVGALVRLTAVFTTGVANSQQIIGIGDAQDGFFFGYNGADFGVMRRRAGEDSWITQTDWNGDDLTFSPTLGNIYQIRYQWLGFGYIQFYVLDPYHPDHGYVRVHTILYPNTSQNTSLLNPTLPLYAQVVNSGNTSNIVLQTPSAAAFEPVNPLDIPRSINASATFADTNNNHLLTIRNKSTFASIANRIVVDLDTLVIGRGSTGATSTVYRLYKNATTTDALAYTDISTANSPVEYSATTTTITGGTLLASYTLADSSLIVPSNRLIVVQPGDTLTIGIQNATNAGTIVAGAFNWVEEF